MCESSSECLDGVYACCVCVNECPHAAREPVGSVFEYEFLKLGGGVCTCASLDRCIGGSTQVCSCERCLCMLMF